MKKAIVVLMTIIMSLSVFACVKVPDVSALTQNPADVTEAPVAEQPTEAPAAEEPTEAPVAEEPTEAPTEEPTEEPTAEPTEEPTPEPTEAPAPAADVLYVNFETMHFYINGVEFVLGKTTLQEMIDAGVPFRASDLENAENNLSKNYQSQGFRIDLGEYYSAQVYVFNDTDAGKKMCDCYVNEIYLPINTNIDQDILSFDFPLNMTMEELIKNSGEPDENRHYDGDNGYYSDTLTYTHESEKYLLDSKFQFEFQNGELKYIYITYLP